VAATVGGGDWADLRSGKTTITDWAHLVEAGRLDRRRSTIAPWWTARTPIAEVTVE
jgi:hypothetical protein